MSTGVLFDIDHFAVHDGPGIRTTIFFKGCPLRCKWCHSPESQIMQPMLGLAQSRCIRCGICSQICSMGAHQVCTHGHSLDRGKCIACGKCVSACPEKALILFGREYSVQQVLDEVLPDQPFFISSGGGVTLTGGEVLMQPEFAGELLQALHQHSIHTIVETSGYGSEDAIRAVCRDTDLFYFDFKLWDAEMFRQYTDGEISIVRRNLDVLSEMNAKIVLRVPMIHGITDTEQNIQMLFDTAVAKNIREIHLLPYNASAPEKYAWLERKYPLAGQTLEDRERLSRVAECAPQSICVKIM